MKIMHEQLNSGSTDSLKIKWDDFPHFTFPWHFHAEYELVYVIRSFGKRFVADHVEDFDDGDLVLLGPNLPHFWKSDDAFFENNPDYKVNAIVIHFHNGFFKEQMDNYPEFFRIRELLNRSARGISFLKPVSQQLDMQLKKLLKMKGLKRLLFFIQVLDKLAQSQQYKLLAGETYRPDLHDWSSSRLEKVIHLVNATYRNPIKLETVAAHAGMNTTAFCRYFREKTGKSFIGFVNEMRIGYACKLLLEGKQTVSQICFESGFNNLSNFNRCFKKMKSVSPARFREQFHRANPASI